MEEALHGGLKTLRAEF